MCSTNCRDPQIPQIVVHFKCAPCRLQKLAIHVMLRQNPRGRTDGHLLQTGFLSNLQIPKEENSFQISQP